MKPQIDNKLDIIIFSTGAFALSKGSICVQNNCCESNYGEISEEWEGKSI